MVGTIVVGFDGSEAAERALVRAAELAEALAARLVVVSVSRSSRAPVDGPDLIVVPSPVGGTMPTGALVAGLASEPAPEPTELAQRQLERARMLLARRRVEAEYMAEIGAAAERLLEVADERDADLLVLGSREHGLVERLLTRPVDEAVARHAGRDVLLVH
jgi:nucleotide-binding universal stress UspA family protein